MWIMSTLGYFSIVRKPFGKDNSRPIAVRARVRNDLVNLLEASGIDAKIIRTEDADYMFRIQITDSGLATIMGVLEESVTYSNFKNEVAKVQGKKRAAVYEGIWWKLLQLQPWPKKAVKKVPSVNSGASWFFPQK